MKLYFVRHGESEANLINEFSNRGTRHPLTEKGRAQTRTLCQNLAGLSFARIYSSPLLRARQTSQILAEAFCVPVEVTDALREFDVGIHEGTSGAEGWSSYRTVVHAWIDDGRFDERMEGGESFWDQHARLVGFLDALVAELGETEASVLLVGHGGLFRCVLPYIAKNLDYVRTETMPIQNTAYILLENVASGYVCREWCGNRIEE